MAQQLRPYRWIALLFALVLAAAVGFLAYDAGLAHGAAAAGQQAVAPAPPPGAFAPYGWYRPWGFGFFFAPFFFFLLFVLVMRGLFWGGPWRRHGCYPRGYSDSPATFDEWHRRAHERMRGEPNGPARDADRPRG